MQNDLKDLTFEMDGAIGSVTRLVESLSDVQTELGYLRDSMDSAAFRGEERLYYREHHRTVRILSDLMYYLMNELVEASEKAYSLHLSIFEAVRGQENAEKQAQPA